MATYLIKKDDKFFVQKVKGFTPKEAVTTVPDSFDKDDYPYLYAEQVDDGFGALVWEVKIDQAAKNTDDNKKLKKDTKEQLYKDYIDGIDSEILSIFQTTDRNKATSLYLTWLMMESRPEFYSDQGLLDDKGKALDTNTKVYDYAQVQIMKALDYSVYLIKQKQKLKTDQDAVG